MSLSLSFSSPKLNPSDSPGSPNSENHKNGVAAVAESSFLTLKRKREEGFTSSLLSKKQITRPKLICRKITFLNGAWVPSQAKHKNYYEGETLDGKPHGFGKEFFASGDVYEGDFDDDRRHGKGKFTYANGDVYEGDFIDGVFHGKGKMSYANGTTYEGDFANGRFHGKGKQRLSNGTVYEGDFDNHKPHGKGKIIYYNGDVYEGDFDNGRCHGQGRLTFVDGPTYECGFVDDKPHGPGKYTCADGSFFEAEFFCYDIISSGIANLGDQLFFDFVCRSSGEGPPRGYALGIMAEYLQTKGYHALADALSSAHSLLRIPTEELNRESERIYQALTLQGLPQLFPYGYQGHAMGLNIVPDLASGAIFFEIFNSGLGLRKYHEAHETDFRKYKTMLTIKVPIESLTLDKIRTLLSPENFKNADDAYRTILDQPGAERMPSDLIPWQTGQKDSECSFRWILAYLKNKMPEQEYKQMLAELRLDCEAAHKIRYPDCGICAASS